MTTKFSIALKLKQRNFSSLHALGRTIVKGLAAHVSVYPNPNPTLAVAGGHLNDLQGAITKWGTKGNRGAKKDLLKLREVRDVVKKDLFQLACYAANITPNNPLMWTAAGFPLKSLPHKIGILQAVCNLRQFISRDVAQGTIKLKWEKPLGASNVVVNGYTVLRSATSAFDKAVEVGMVTKTSFIDTQPGAGLNYYWVIPLHTAGEGVISDICVAFARLV